MFNLTESNLQVRLTTPSLMVVFYVGEYDLSIGSTFALCLAVIGITSNNNLSLPPFILLMTTLIVLIGGINRYLSNKFTSLLITFILMYIIRGIVFIITGGRPLYQDHETDILKMLDWGVNLVPNPLFVLILVTLVLSVFFNRSASAKKLVAVGINQKKLIYWVLIPVPTNYLRLFFQRVWRCLPVFSITRIFIRFTKCGYSIWL